MGAFLSRYRRCWLIMSDFRRRGNETATPGADDRGVSQLIPDTEEGKLRV